MRVTCFIRYEIDPFQREERNFVEIVAGTFNVPPPGSGAAS